MCQLGTKCVLKFIWLILQINAVVFKKCVNRKREKINVAIFLSVSLTCFKSLWHDIYHLVNYEKTTLQIFAFFINSTRMFPCTAHLFITYLLMFLKKGLINFQSVCVVRYYLNEVSWLYDAKIWLKFLLSQVSDLNVFYESRVE